VIDKEEERVVQPEVSAIPTRHALMRAALAVLQLAQPAIRREELLPGA